MSIINLKEETLVSETTVAQWLSMTVSWLRKERRLRKQGKPHTFDVDPIYIGKSPRYPLSDVMNWVDNLKQNSFKARKG